jgi:hypothetical protein
MGSSRYGRGSRCQADFDGQRNTHECEGIYVTQGSGTPEYGAPYGGGPPDGSQHDGGQYGGAQYGGGQPGGGPYGGEPGGGPYGGGQPGGGPYGGGQPGAGTPYGAASPYGGNPYGGNPYGGDPYGGNPYGGNPYGSPPVQPRNGLGVAALVLGIIAILSSWTVVGGILLGIGAIVCGLLGRGRAKRNEANNGGLALAGLVTGAIGLIIGIVMIAVYVAFAHSDQVQNLQDCLNNAQGDSAAIQQCQLDWTNSFRN